MEEVKQNLCQSRAGAGWAPDVVIGRVIARGANSTVFRAGIVQDSDGESPLGRVASEGEYVVRIPRHGSDTTSVDMAVAEYAHCLVASEHKIGPHIQDAFYARHTTRQQRKGLNLLMERLGVTLEDAMLSETYDEDERERLGKLVDETVSEMARVGVFHFDLKPQNVMLNVDETRACVIDFGCEFCQHVRTEHPGPHVMGADLLPLDLLPPWVVEDAACTARILKATMFLVLSAVADCVLVDAAKDLKREDTETRRARNPIRSRTMEATSGLTVCEVRVVRDVLRHTSVKETLRHYCGARKACLRRLWSAATGAGVS